MKVDKNKKKFVKKKATLALGEVTGHSHQLLQPVLVQENEEGLATEMVLDQSNDLVHEEHNTLTLPKGEATIIIQREVDLLGEVRQVMD